MKKDLETLKKLIETATCYTDTTEAAQALQKIETYIASLEGLEEYWKAKDRAMNCAHVTGGFPQL